MIMDFLRSCYNTQCRFFNDSNLQSPIHWYFTHPGAKIFPGINAFNSLNWRDIKADAPIGEVAGLARPWSNGQGIPTTGQTFCGSFADFQNGLVTTGERVPISPDGVRLCCGGLPNRLLNFLPLRSFPFVSHNDNFSLLPRINSFWQSTDGIVQVTFERNPPVGMRLLISGPNGDEDCPFIRIRPQGTRLLYDFGDPVGNCGDPGTTVTVNASPN